MGSKTVGAECRSNLRIAVSAATPATRPWWNVYTHKRKRGTTTVLIENALHLKTGKRGPGPAAEAEGPNLISFERKLLSCLACRFALLLIWGLIRFKNGQDVHFISFIFR